MSPRLGWRGRGFWLGLATLVAVVVTLGGCTRDDDLIRVEVQKLTLAEGEAANATAERLTRHGRRALPSIEAAMHTADEHGRKNLVLALRRLGDVESVPLLLHLGAYDPSPDVRREAVWTLKTWAAANDARAQKSREAVRRLDEILQSEETG